MTTINAKADRNTLKSTLEKGEVQLLAGILANIAGSVEGYKVLETTLKDAMKLVKPLLVEQAKEAEAAAQARIDRRESKKAERNAEKEQALKALQVEQDAMLANMIRPVEEGGLGLSRDVALVACEAAIKARRKAIESASVREHAVIEVDGVRYEIPRAGNTTQALKDLQAASGLADRAAFIAKYEVTAE